MLIFSDDEQTIVTGTGDAMLRFWEAPEVGVGAPVAGGHQVWSPSGGRVAVTLPGATKVAIGDPSGHVHLVAAGASREDLQALNDDVSFFGHNSAVRALATAGDGTVLASAAADNTVRVWSAVNGEPMPYVIDVTDAPVGIGGTPREELTSPTASRSRRLTWTTFITASRLPATVDCLSARIAAPCGRSISTRVVTGSCAKYGRVHRLSECSRRRQEASFSCSSMRTIARASSICQKDK